MDNAYNHLDGQTDRQTDRQTDISFCLPVYNVKDFLEDCLLSIQGQDLEKHNIAYEILCLDDGSSDGSYEFLLEKAKTVPQLKVFKNPENKGVSYTRNSLTQMARGKYIWYVDPDDMLIKDVANLFFGLAENFQADVFLGNYIRVEENIKGNIEYFNNEELLNTKVVPMAGDLPKDQNGKPMCSLCTGLFRREFLIENQLFLKEKMIAQEDTLLYYEFSLRTDKVYKTQIPCYLYRQRKSSVMNTHNDERSKKYYISMLEMLKCYQEHLEKEDYKDKQKLLNKIHHTQQNVASCLAMIYDKKYITEQLKILKAEKIYPYKFRGETLKTNESFFRKLLTYLLPVEPFFWLYHWIYINYDKNRKE